MPDWLSRKNAIRFLLVAIIFVLMRIFWNVNQCLGSGGHWNPKTEVCEHQVISKPKELTGKNNSKI